MLNHGRGTGNIALEVACRGQAITARDISQRMVEVALERAEQAGLAERVAAKHLHDTLMSSCNKWACLMEQWYATCCTTLLASTTLS